MLKIAMSGTASFDRSGRFRYTLHRRWSDGPRQLCFCMLNPSTADAKKNDPTVRRCIGYAMDWGYDALEVVNIFALRSTDPAGLRVVEDPIGPRNTQAIVRAARRSEMTVAAWGTHGSLYNRGTDVLERLAGICDLRVLGLTQQGHPKHPLYLPKNAQPVPFPAESLA